MAMASRCDAIVVIGSSNSSNTRALEKLAIEAGCPRVFRVNHADELPDDLHGTVGVTAGASAPEELVDEIVRSPRAAPWRRAREGHRRGRVLPAAAQHPRAAGGDRHGLGGDARWIGGPVGDDERSRVRRQRCAGCAARFLASGSCSPPPPPRSGLFLHVLAATVWVGGQFVLAGLVGTLRRQSPEAPRGRRLEPSPAWPGRRSACWLCHRHLEPDRASTSTNTTTCLPGHRVRQDHRRHRRRQCSC